MATDLPQEPPINKREGIEAPSTTNISVSDAESLGFSTAGRMHGGMDQPSIKTTSSSDEDSSLLLDLEDTQIWSRRSRSFERRMEGRIIHGSHHFFTLLLQGRLFEAPIRDPKRILDLGTGTGIWAMDVADEYPNAQVKGIDVSPIQPNYTPPNCHFEIDDYNLEFVQTKKYDLIHQRELQGSVPRWQDFYTKCYDALLPGGWMDIAEPDTSNYYTEIKDFAEESEKSPMVLKHDHPLQTHRENLMESGREVGMVFDIAPRIETSLKRVGFVNIEVRRVKAPISTWAKNRRDKEIGAWNQLRCEEGVGDWSMRRFSSELGWNVNEVTVLSASLRKAFRDKSLKLYMLFYFVTAQKPPDTQAQPPELHPPGPSYPSSLAHIPEPQIPGRSLTSILSQPPGLIQPQQPVIPHLPDSHLPDLPQPLGFSHTPSTSHLPGPSHLLELSQPAGLPEPQPVAQSLGPSQAPSLSNILNPDPSVPESQVFHAFELPQAPQQYLQHPQTQQDLPPLKLPVPLFPKSEEESPTPYPPFSGPGEGDRSQRMTGVQALFESKERRDVKLGWDRLGKEI